MKILGIETSCDETSAAIVSDDRQILAHLILSQIDEHKLYGGVIPELASRSHLANLDLIIKKVLLKANIEAYQLDAIAATGGPGLIGGIIVGVMMAKAIALVINKPFIAVNHLEAHALTIRLCQETNFPYLLLLVSGGHCQILITKGVGNYQQLGTTIDDALGEAYDKVAKMLGFDYPGGPIIEKLALLGDRQRFKFPLPLINQPNCNFSFSGLKTAVKKQIDQLTQITNQDIADIAASFEYTVANILINRLTKAIKITTETYQIKEIVIAGGVAANNYLKTQLTKLANNYNLKLIAPPPNLCTDNAAMISWVGIERLKLGIVDKLDFEPRSRWALTN